MSKINCYRDLLVWEQAMDLTVAVYRMTRAWPKDELYGLTSQVRRAATSVPASIAEGYGQESSGSYLRFLRIARGTLKEMETHLLIAQRIEIAGAVVVGALCWHGAKVSASCFGR